MFDENTIKLHRLMQGLTTVGQAVCDIGDVLIQGITPGNEAKREGIAHQLELAARNLRGEPQLDPANTRG